MIPVIKTLNYKQTNYRSKLSDLIRNIDEPSIDYELYLFFNTDMHLKLTRYKTMLYYALH